MLTVEDGSGVAEADTWIALDDADDYWTQRANADWIAAIAAGEPGKVKREGALRQGFDYLGFVYRWPGQPRTIQQRGPWPRSGVPSGRGYFPFDAIPTQVISSQLLLAAEALNRNILLKVEPSRVLVKETKSVRGITKSQEFQVGGVDQNTGLIRLPLVDVHLRGIVISTGNGTIGSVPLVRA